MPVIFTEELARPGARHEAWDIYRVYGAWPSLADEGEERVGYVRLGTATGRDSRHALAAFRRAVERNARHQESSNSVLVAVRAGEPFAPHTLGTCSTGAAARGLLFGRNATRTTAQLAEVDPWAFRDRHGARA